MNRAIGRHEAACSEWLASRPALEVQARRILAGPGAIADTLARPLAVTSLAGDYERCAGWVLALGASPVGALAVVKNGAGGAGMIWRLTPGRLAPDAAATLRAYVETLGGWERPGYWVDGVRSAGASFHVQPWFASPDAHMAAVDAVEWL